jgi:Ca-activated chloride channel homolog
MKITVQTDRSLVRASSHSTRYALASIVAPRVERAHARNPVNVAFVLDRSGSMNGSKIKLARRAVDHALRLLRSDDRFALVVYDSEIDVVVESMPATHSACEHARARLASIEARDSTDLCGGWLAGCEQIARYIEGQGLGRALLLTDGLANQGVTDHEEIVAHARELRRRGVVTSTFGVGADFDERLLQQMADAGAGHFYFIERAEQIPDLLASELGETLEVVASGVTLTIETPTRLHAQVLNKFPSTREPDRLTIQIGDLVSGQELSLVTRLDFPDGQEGDRIAATFNLQAARAQGQGRSVELAWTFASHAACDAQPRNQAVDEAVGQIYAARAQAEAVELNRGGDYAAAERLLGLVGEKIGTYAGRSPILARAIDELRQAGAVTSSPMSAMAMKVMHARSGSALRSRGVDGKARRRPDDA